MAIASNDKILPYYFKGISSLKKILEEIKILDDLHGIMKEINDAQGESDKEASFRDKKYTFCTALEASNPGMWNNFKYDVL